MLTTFADPMRKSTGRTEASVMIRAFIERDLPAIQAMQSKCPAAAQWHEDDYLRLAGDPCGMILVAEHARARPPHIVGFAAFHRVIEEAELRNLAADPAHQRQGVARSLLEEGIRMLQESGARRIFLEVRASNHPALALYASLGFGLHSTRKDYYQSPIEDALVMALDITPGSETPSR
jgi:ribosomal-protein-alanine N-acetyltransferase